SGRATVLVATDVAARGLDLPGIELPDPEIQIVHQIKGGDVDWALGAALVHALESSRVGKQDMFDARSMREAAAVEVLPGCASDTAPVVLIACFMAAIGAVLLLRRVVPKIAPCNVEEKAH
ncbi:unnamed protein product, partial [Polarella glacialis]